MKLLVVAALVCSSVLADDYRHRVVVNGEVTFPGSYEFSLGNPNPWSVTMWMPAGTDAERFTRRVQRRLNENEDFSGAGCFAAADQNVLDITCEEGSGTIELEVDYVFPDSVDEFPDGDEDCFGFVRRRDPLFRIDQVCSAVPLFDFSINGLEMSNGTVMRCSIVA